MHHLWLKFKISILAEWLTFISKQAIEIESKSINQALSAHKIKPIASSDVKRWNAKRDLSSHFRPRPQCANAVINASAYYAVSVFLHRARLIPDLISRFAFNYKHLRHFTCNTTLKIHRAPRASIRKKEALNSFCVCFVFFLNFILNARCIFAGALFNLSTRIAACNFNRFYWKTFRRRLALRVGVGGTMRLCVASLRRWRVAEETCVARCVAAV